MSKIKEKTDFIFMSVFSFSSLDAFSDPKISLLSMPSGEMQVLVCNIEDFGPKTLSVNWRRNNSPVTGFTDPSPQKSGPAYSAVSVLKVTKTDWDSEAVYTCEVTHQGETSRKKVSKGTVQL